MGQDGRTMPRNVKHSAAARRRSAPWRAIPVVCFAWDGTAVERRQPMRRRRSRSSGSPRSASTSPSSAAPMWASVDGQLRARPAWRAACSCSSRAVRRVYVSARRAPAARAPPGEPREEEQLAAAAEALRDELWRPGLDAGSCPPPEPPHGRPDPRSGTARRRRGLDAASSTSGCVRRPAGLHEVIDWRAAWRATPASVTRPSPATCATSR